MKEKERKNLHKRSINPVVAVVFVILAVYVISVMSMYVWAFFTSLKTQSQFRADPLSFPKSWPWKWAWENYFIAFREMKVEVILDDYRGPVYFESMLFNSLLYALGGTLVNNLTIWLVAYLMVKFSQYRFNKFLYTLNIFLMTIPVYGTLPAALAVFKFFGWYDNYSFILFNNIAFTGTNLLFFHSFIKGLGKEYYEAAYIDGAGNFGIMTKIAFPLTISLFWVFVLLGAINRWNDYMTMLIWMPNYPTLAYGFFKTSVSSATEMSFVPQQVSIAMSLMIPMLILFFLFQDVIMGNLRLGAIKG